MELSRVTTALKLRNLEIPGTKQRQEEVQLLHFCFAQQIKEDYAQMASAFPKQTREFKLLFYNTAFSRSLFSSRVWKENITAKAWWIQEHSIQKEWPVSAGWVWWESRGARVSIQAARFLLSSIRSGIQSNNDLTKPQDWGHKAYHYSQQGSVCVFQVTHSQYRLQWLWWDQSNVMT